MAENAPPGAQDIEAEYETAKELYASVGFMTILWAQMEGTLDLINRAIFYHAGGSQFEDRFPLALDRKLQFMRRCHRDLPQLKAIRTASDRLIDLVHATKQERHDIIHGDTESLPITQMDLVILRRSNEDKLGLYQHRRTINENDLAHLIDKILNLIELSNQHSHAVVGAIFPQSKKNEGGGITD